MSHPPDFEWNTSDDHAAVAVIVPLATCSFPRSAELRNLSPGPSETSAKYQSHDRGRAHIDFMTTTTRLPSPSKAHAARPKTPTSISEPRATPPSASDGSGRPDNRWPMDLANGRASAFKPRGFLVAVFDSADEANTATVNLREAGFDTSDLRTYSAAQILRNECLRNTRNFAARAIGTLRDSRDALATQYSNARDGRVSVWIRVPDRSTASRSVRLLVDQRVRQFHYFGHRSQQDIRVR